MIPLLQFDPASLTLWYDAHLVGVSRGHREIGLALEHAVVGDDRVLRHLVRCIDDRWVQTRAANVASVAWHEKRHFLDFVLTNYGALRIRTYLEAYVNVHGVLASAGEGGRVLMPLDCNLDEDTREMAGLGPLDERVLRVAQAVASRKDMLRQDQRPISTPFGTMQIGGESLLEAIAYHVQLAKTHRVFGMDILNRVQEDHPGQEVVHYKYRWAWELLIRAGLLKIDAAGEGKVKMDDEPFLPLCYGALAARLWGQEQSRSERASSYMPGERFGSLVMAIRERHPDYRNAAFDDAWEIVNRTCKHLFGRTAIEETEADFRHEEDFLETVERALPGSVLARALADLHALRGRLIDTLKSDPGLLLHQAQWSDTMVHRTQPLIVVAAPAGEIGEPPPGYARLSGYRHPDTDYDSVPEARWWWSAINEQWPDPGDEEVFCLRDRQAWTAVASDYAPMGKLMYAGHKQRIMLGPELLSARLRFQELTGITLQVHSAFSHPANRHDAGFWNFITGCDHFRCDLSSETVRKPDGFMLDPWELRLRPNLRNVLFGTVQNQRRMAFALWRDWTPWLLSQEFGDYFTSFEVDQAALYEQL